MPAAPSCRKSEQIPLVQTMEFGLADIYIVISLAEIKVNNIDRVNLCHFFIRFPTLQILTDKTGRTEEHTVEVRILALVLDFDKYLLT